MKAVKPSEVRSGYAVQEGTSDPDGAVDGSSTPVIMEFGPGSSEAWVVNRMLLFIFAATNVTDDKYGDLDLSSGTGIEIEIHNTGGLVRSITGLIPIKQNAQLTGLAYDARQNLFAANPKSISMRYTFSNDLGGEGILLDGSKGEKIIIPLADNFSTFSSHTFRFGASKVR